MGNVDAKSPRAQARGVHFSGGQHQKSQGDVPDIYDDKSIQSANEKVGFLLELLNKVKRVFMSSLIAVSTSHLVILGKI